MDPCLFVRATHEHSLFQQIFVTFAGRRHEAAVAYIAISVTKWIRFKGLCVSRLFDEIASDQERGWAVVNSADEAKQWELSLALEGPRAVEELAREVGGELLKKTETIRKIAHNILSHFDAKQSVACQIAEMEQIVPAPIVSEASRLAAAPGVIQLYNSEDIYLLALLLILNHCREQFVQTRQNLLSNNDFMWTIQLVADGILQGGVEREAGGNGGIAGGRRKGGVEEKGAGADSQQMGRMGSS